MAPVHDALMVEGSADSIDEIVARTQEAMAEASAVILDRFRLRADASVVRWPGRYMDARGRKFWARVLALLSHTQRLQIDTPHSPTIRCLADGARASTVELVLFTLGRIFNPKFPSRF